MTFRIGENEKEIDRLFNQHVKALPRECQHALVIADVDK